MIDFAVLSAALAMVCVFLGVYVVRLRRERHELTLEYIRAGNAWPPMARLPLTINALSSAETMARLPKQRPDVGVS